MKNIINIPAASSCVADLRAGDIIYLTGTVATGRDDVHRRVVDEKIPCPFDFRNSAIFHAGPIVKEDNGYELVSIGPTSSIRMEAWAADFIAAAGVRIMIGKGGMGEKTAAACREYKTIHCIYPGGCAVLGAGQTKKIETVYWQELGMPECIWVMQVIEFGPLIVSIDTTGNNLFTKNAAFYRSQRDGCMRPVMETLAKNRG